MLLLDLSDDLLDRVLYLALLQPKFYTYDKNYDEVLYPRLVLVRAVCYFTAVEGIRRGRLGK